MIRLLAILSLLSSSFAYGAELSAVQLDKSTIAFVSRQMNVPVEGIFQQFSAQISIDPARPEAGRARIEIDLASIDAG
ncbi:MAG: YceI family protein, partial [Gammaproteobacteria bacterium]|nr:YceI family protein [Gammaproteobacteria bacterium]